MELVPNLNPCSNYTRQLMSLGERIQQVTWDGFSHGVDLSGLPDDGVLQACLCDPHLEEDISKWQSAERSLLNSMVLSQVYFYPFHCVWNFYISTVKSGGCPSRLAGSPNSRRSQLMPARARANRRQNQLI